MWRVLVAAVVAVGFFGCSVCTEIETFYRGARTGTLVVREDGPAGGGLSFREMAGPWDERNAFSGSAVCLTGRQEPAPGHVIRAWLSPDDIETVDLRCRPPDAGLFDPPPDACAPGATDPQGRKEYELPTVGSLVHQIELVDP